MAKLLIPETETPKTLSCVKFETVRAGTNVIEAAANGAATGLHLALQVGAMMIAFIGIIWMLNSVFGLINLSFDKILGYAFSPVSFLMGVPWPESVVAGKLIGTKIVFNEFIAYMQLGDLIKSGALSPRTITILTYALCSFANFGSIAIMIAGIGTIAPEKKSLTSQLGIKAVLAGTLTSLMTATIAGILL
jgi:CNT family concentrative nucleoside transporter